MDQAGTRSVRPARRTWESGLRRTAFVLLPFAAAVGATLRASPDLSDCVVGPNASISLLLEGMGRFGVFLLTTFFVMFAVRSFGRRRSLSQRVQLSALACLLARLVVAAGSFVLFSPGPLNEICKNVPGYPGGS